MTNHKNFFKQFVEFINTADENLAQQLISPTAKFYVPGQVEPLIGPAGYLATIWMMREGFPDIQWYLEEIISENDKSAIRFTMTGTHKGTFFGVPPTGNSIKIQATNFYRLINNQIIEEYGQPDLLALLQQIGAVPTIKK
ncbi:MAG TPA: ester cyclase [Flavobacterium sp.]|nr:ester cyclase [Flavobacterium sp.]